VSSDEARDALAAYGRLLGLAADEIDDPVLAAETVALLDELRAAAERGLGEAPPHTFTPPRP
jgi:hypothetical protein